MRAAILRTIIQIRIFVGRHYNDDPKNITLASCLYKLLMNGKC